MRKELQRIHDGLLDKIKVQKELAFDFEELKDKDTADKLNILIRANSSFAYEINSLIKNYESFFLTEEQIDKKMFFPKDGASDERAAIGAKWFRSVVLGDLDHRDFDRKK